MKLLSCVRLEFVSQSLYWDDVFPDQYEDMIRYEVRPATYTEEMAIEISKQAVKLNKTAYLHIKIDTGMGRIGFASIG